MKIFCFVINVLRVFRDITQIDMKFLVSLSNPVLSRIGLKILEYLINQPKEEEKELEFVN